MPHARPAARLSRPSRAWVALVALVLVLGGCSIPKHQAAVDADDAGSADVESAPSVELEPFYRQVLAWESCDEGECAMLEVPLDYAEPTGKTIRLAVARHRATSADRIGSLLTNPGGPGSSGVGFLAGALDVISDEVQARYDVVGFDPRGVQHSIPEITCLTAPEMDDLLAYDPDYSTPEGVQRSIDRYADFSAACLDQTGPVLGHVDTISAARDMDVLRAALGDKQLYYLGFSYGTQLGATYANLFPAQVGRLVLDGAVDPTVSNEDATLSQAVGFENALRAYVEDCQAGARCPLTGSVDDGMGQIRDLLDRIRIDPLPTGTDRPLTQALAFSGIAVTLYAQSYWTYLTSALSAAFDGDGSILLNLSDAYYDRDANGTYSSNQTEAFWSVGCLDSRSSADLDDMAAEADRIVAAAPTVGSFFTYGGVVCADWAVPEVGPLDDYSAPGAATILVVGTTNDPATPYAQAQALATILSSGVLLTYEGEGHTAYGSSNDCVTDAVDTYLLEGSAPEDGATC